MGSAIENLEQVFGSASEAGFGSAVFVRQSSETEPRSLETDGRDVYRIFCGDNWDGFGVDNWLANWKLLHERLPGREGDIIAEIQAIRDPEAGSAAQMLLESGPDPEHAENVLRSAFNAGNISQLQIFKIGDGGAMSGAIIAAETNANRRVFLIILLD